MGEAKRRAARELMERPAREAELAATRAQWAEFEEIASEDPDDRATRIAHGFSYDDWNDRTTLCRNGCGETYDDIVGGKMRVCSAASETRTAEEAGL